MQFLRSPFLRRFQLDIVGFLAILGESSISQTSQISFLALASFLPRLIPAPQVLIPASRQTRLPTVDATVVGVRSGNRRNQLSYLAHVLYNVEKLPRYHIQCLEIQRRDPNLKKHIEANLNPFGPLAWVAMGGFVLWACLLVLAIYFEDGMSMLALIFLGSLSTLAQIGSYYRLRLTPYRRRRAVLPPSDIVIFSRKGGYAYVRCDEEIARTLYIEPEECEYVVGDKLYRLIALTGTLLLMGGVITLGNARTDLQIAFAGTFLILNAAYWLVAALPDKLHWRISLIDVKKKGPEGAPENGRIAAENFTQALWTMIALTGTSEWISTSNIAPLNSPWRKWLAQAEQNLGSTLKFDSTGRLVEPKWDAQAALTSLLEEAAAEEGVKTDGEDLSSSAQEEPAQDEGIRLDRDQEAKTLETFVL